MSYRTALALRTFVLVFGGVLAVGGAPARAQQSTADAPGAQGAADAAALRVALRESPPFVTRESDGTWGGIAVELWRGLAEEERLTYAFEPMELQAIFDGLAAGQIDVALGALTMTAEREVSVDFTHPFYTAGLGIALGPAARSGWRGALAGALSWELLQALAALGAVLGISGALMWICERRRSPEDFGGGALRGIGEGFWWSAVTMTTVGYGDRVPRTLGGRVVALVWMFAGVITISGFTAAIATTLTLGQLRSSISGPGDLPRFEVASVAGSTSEDYLRERQITTRTRADVIEVLGAVRRGEVAVAVHDAPILRYWVSRRFAADVSVLPTAFETQQYAIALAPESPLREPLNRRLLAALQSERFRSLLELYLGS